MSENKEKPKTKKVTVHAVGWTTARIELEPIVLEVPAEATDEEIEALVEDQIDEDDWEETGVFETQEHKSLEIVITDIIDGEAEEGEDDEKAEGDDEDDEEGDEEGEDDEEAE